MLSTSNRIAVALACAIPALIAAKRVGTAIDLQPESRLWVAGTVNAEAKPGENGTLLVSGTRDVRMTEFGLKPPTLMLGTMKVDERIKVGFDIVLKD
jgi:hypothetical protein